MFSRSILRQLTKVQVPKRSFVEGTCYEGPLENSVSIFQFLNNTV